MGKRGTTWIWQLCVETEYEYKNNLALRQPTTISINTILYTTNLNFCMATLSLRAVFLYSAFVSRASSLRCPYFKHSLLEHSRDPVDAPRTFRDAESETSSPCSSSDSNRSFDISDNRDDEISNELTESVSLGVFVFLSRRKIFLIMVIDKYPQTENITT